MIGAFFCLFAFAVCYVAGRRSLVGGIGALFAIGYGYGILRANILQTLMHFVFDAAVMGLFAAQLFRRRPAADTARMAGLRSWMIPLVAWPVLLSLIPIQDPLIQLVALRGTIFFIPFLILGARLSGSDVRWLAIWCACLNWIAFGFATAEFIIGVEPFFPLNTLTEIIYRSKDIAGATAYRIPATFQNAHAYSGTVVLTLPLLLGVWWHQETPRHQQFILASGAVVAALGVFMAGARMPAVILFVLFAAALLSTRVRGSARVAGLVTLLFVAFAVSRSERLQRYQTLEDTEYVAQRVQGSVNQNFLQLVVSYPLGNGMGGGGTSIPYFLQSRLKNKIGMENEYARIVAEQGIPGLIIWVGFIVWALTRRANSRRNPFFIARRLALVACGLSFLTGLLGTGLFAAVPQTPLLLLLLGWIAVPSAPPTAQPAAARRPVPQGLGTGLPGLSGAGS